MSADAKTPASGTAGIGIVSMGRVLERQHAARAVVAVPTIRVQSAELPNSIARQSAKVSSNFVFPESSLLNIISLSFTPFTFGPV